MSEQKIVLITGANKGIGLELVKYYRKKNWQVYAACRNSSDELKKLSVSVIERVDITLDQSIKALLAKLEHVKLDLLINNAGSLYRSQLGSFSYKEMLENVNINAFGALRITESLLLKLSKRAKVVMISSKMGSIEDNMSGGAYSYRMSKAALNAAAKSLSIDLKPQGITVVLLHPGWVMTNMGGKRAPVTVESSVEGMANVIEHVDLESTGKFFDYSGDIIPW